LVFPARYRHHHVPKCREFDLLIRVLLIGAAIATMAAAQTPRRQAAQAPPRAAEPAQTAAQQALDEPMDMGGEGATAQAPAPVKGASPWRSLASLVFVLGIAGAGVWALRKWGIRRLPGSGGGRMKIEETLALGERRFVSILRVDEERFLVASYPQGMSLLGRLEVDFAQGLGAELEQQMQVQAPIPVRDMEARLKGERQ
jgi:flagellar biogenesis protein FliO